MHSCLAAIIANRHQSGVGIPLSYLLMSFAQSLLYARVVHLTYSCRHCQPADPLLDEQPKQGYYVPLHGFGTHAQLAILLLYVWIQVDMSRLDHLRDVRLLHMDECSCQLLLQRGGANASAEGC